ncbi:hypothetical protein ACFLZW_02105 [Chloroflexota bacterium]
MANTISSRCRSILIVAFFLLAGCVPWRVLPENMTAIPSKIISPTSIANTTTTKPTPDPIATATALPPNGLMIAYLDEAYLVFERLDTGERIQKFELSQATSLAPPYRLGSVYYLRPTCLLVQLYSSATYQRAVLAVNPDSGEIKEVILSAGALRGLLAHERLVLQDISNNTIVYILQDDLTIEKVDLETEVFQLIEADDDNVLAVNHQPLNQNGKTFIEVIQINIRTGDTKRVLVNCPPFSDPLLLPRGRSSEDKLAGWLLTISPDLEYVYIFYNSKIDDEGLTQTLGMFESKSLEEVNSTKDPNFITLLNVTRLSSLQYRNWSYPSKAFTGTEGINQGLRSPFDLYSLAPLVDFYEIIKKEYKNVVSFVPFGNYFLIGTDSRVILVSLDGEIYREYPLPWDRILLVRGVREYSIVEYHAH